MRRSISVATLLLVVGCAQPPLVQTAPLPTDQPLAVRLHQPIGGALHYSLSEPAYVAIFSVSRGYGIGLVFPHYESQVGQRSHAGLNQETMNGRRRAWGHSTVSRYEERAIFRNPDAYYIIASKSPLPVEAILQSPQVLHSLLGERTFRANNFTETWNALEELLVADLPHDHWASDAFVTWREPFLSVAYSEPTFLHCQGRRSFYVPGLFLSDFCNRSLSTEVTTPPVTGPVVGIARREPPSEPRDRDPMLPLEPPMFGPDDGIARMSRFSREASRREDAAGNHEESRASEQRRVEPARAPDRAPAARERSPAPSLPADTRPQQQSREDGKQPEAKPDP